MAERLDKFIASQIPDISRKGAREMIKSKKVSINGELCRDPEKKLIPGTDAVTVSGREIAYKEHLYIMLNKPAGTVCSTCDGLSDTVINLLPPELRRQGLFPAGRLDKDTVGFVLITDDGELAHRILSPKSHVDKKYYVRLRDNVLESAVDIFKSGMEISGEKFLSAKLEILGAKECNLTLKEGRYHQIKRMFESLGNKVVYLKRTEIAGIAIDEKLSEGDCRELTGREIMALKSV